MSTEETPNLFGDEPAQTGDTSGYRSPGCEVVYPTYRDNGRIADFLDGRTLYLWPDGFWRYLDVPPLPSIFTTGYGQRGPSYIGDFFDSVRAVDGVVVDIRLKPWSDREVWRQEGPAGLAARFKCRYLHVPELGNLNHKNRDAGILLADAEAGIARVLRVLEGGHSPVLLCGCEKFERCHRAEVSRLLAIEGYETRELHWFIAPNATDGGTR